MTEQVAIVGDGQMGLVLAGVLAQRGVGVRLWGRSEERVSELAATRRSPRRLPGFVLPQAVEVTADHEALLRGASVIVNAIPTQFIRSVWKRLGPYIPTGAPVVSVSKGIENDTLLRPTQVIADATGDDPDDPSRPMCALSGPTIAAELAEHGLLFLLAPVKRVTGYDTVIPLARLEKRYMPGEDRITKAVKEVLEFG